MWLLKKSRFSFTQKYTEGNVVRKGTNSMIILFHHNFLLNSDPSCLVKEKLLAKCEFVSLILANIPYPDTDGKI